jgi:hypothetical protein
MPYSRGDTVALFSDFFYLLRQPIDKDCRVFFALGHDGSRFIKLLHPIPSDSRFHFPKN